MGRNENIAVFEDTANLCKENKVIAEALHHSIKNQKLILESNQVEVKDLRKFDSPAKIMVSKRRTLEAAAFYKGTRTAVLNFASATNPGGGVVHGASAQEECICRCCGLYFCLDIQELWDKFYIPHRKANDPAYNDDLVYTPDITVFKTDTSIPQPMRQSEWYKVDIITCAAPNVRALTDKIRKGELRNPEVISVKRLLSMHEKRLKRILDVAVKEGEETIILGAYGCGAFGNDPGIVAQAAKNVLPDYLHAFKNIEYAVYCGPKDDTNYKVFAQMLKGL
jgi:uncharacterized protein (TIGR02452 family)